MRFNIGVIILFSFIHLISCDNDEMPASSESHVYLTGSEDNRPAYWSNGTMHVLSVGVGKVIGITKNGDDVYAGGFTSEFPDKLVIWVNDQPKYFYDSKPNVKYNDFLRIDGDNYFSGHIDSVIQIEPSESRVDFAAYWKNGKRFILPEGDGYQVRYMKVAKDDIYIVGLGSYNAWTVWKNGKELEIPAQQDWFSSFKSLTIDGEDVYIIYRTYTDENSPYLGNQAWKDGVTTNLIISNPSVHDWSVTAYQGTFYFAGARIDEYPVMTFITPAYWKREPNRMDEQTLLSFPENTLNVFCDDIWKRGNDVYAVGSDNAPNPPDHVILWINTRLIPPFDGTNDTFKLHRAFVF